MHQTVDIFGAKRFIFGSNFTIEKLWTGYANLLTLHLAASANFSHPEHHTIFYCAAAKIYYL